MSTAQTLFNKLTLISSPPTEETFAEIEKRKDELSPLLLKEVADFADNPEMVERQGERYIRHIVSLFILASYRSKDAFPLIIKLISRQGDEVVQLTGEVFTEALSRILA